MTDLAAQYSQFEHVLGTSFIRAIQQNGCFAHEKNVSACDARTNVGNIQKSLMFYFLNVI